MRMTNEEVIKILKARKDCESESCPSDVACYQCNEAFNVAIETLKQQNQKEGHWVWDKDSEAYRCSLCNHFPWRVNTQENDEVFIELNRTNAYKFCPTCGAKMKEGV